MDGRFRYRRACTSSERASISVACVFTCLFSGIVVAVLCAVLVALEPWLALSALALWIVSTLLVGLAAILALSGVTHTASQGRVTTRNRVWTPHSLVVMGQPGDPVRFVRDGELWFQRVVDLESWRPEMLDRMVEMLREAGVEVTDERPREAWQAWSADPQYRLRCTLESLFRTNPRRYPKLHAHEGDLLRTEHHDRLELDLGIVPPGGLIARPLFLSATELRCGDRVLPLVEIEMLYAYYAGTKQNPSARVAAWHPIQGEILLGRVFWSPLQEASRCAALNQLRVFSKPYLDRARAHELGEVPLALGALRRIRES